MTDPRDHLTADELSRDSLLPLVDMSYFARPDWAEETRVPFSGTLVLHSTGMLFPKEREPYPGEDTFPDISIDFITDNGTLVPVFNETIRARNPGASLWDVVPGTGRIWQETGDGKWSRASFPLTLTDRYMGQARNCVATFVFKAEAISRVCLQCSQETADLNDRQVGDIRALLHAEYHPGSFGDSTQVVERHLRSIANRLPVFRLSQVDTTHALAAYFGKSLHTNASTSVGAVLVDGRLYTDPPMTRHGAYPYPEDMRHGVYSVTKSLAGALALLYFAERYGPGIFDELITDHVPALAHHPGWLGVTFSHTLDMVTGTVGGEDAEHLFQVLVLPRTAAEAMDKIAALGDAPPVPGEKFNYASTNLFVLSWALQDYVEKIEGKGVYYWDLVREHVLEPIGAAGFRVLHTVEDDGSRGLPRLAYGALPTLDEAAKIARLINDEGNHNGIQLLNREKTREALGRSSWPGYDTGNDHRGAHYRHSFWSTTIGTKACSVNVHYMLGFGANHVVFLPSGLVALRFMDEFDMDITDLVRGMEEIRSSCER